MTRFEAVDPSSVGKSLKIDLGPVHDPPSRCRTFKSSIVCDWEKFERPLVLRSNVPLTVTLENRRSTVKEFPDETDQ